MQYELKYLRGSIFFNTMSSCVASVIAQMLGNYFVAKFGVKITFVASYSLSIAALAIVIIC